MVGELALDGTTRPTKGALSMAMAAAEQQGPARACSCPAASAAEAAVVEGVEVIPVASLAQAVGVSHRRDRDRAARPRGSTNCSARFSAYDVDFADVRGQEMAKRALTVAAAGGHNILMLGPPGSGKTMLAKRMPTILPDLTPGESIETTRIYSAVGRLEAGPAAAGRPPVPLAAPHDQQRRPGRRRLDALARRNLAGPQRRAVPRRTARVQPPARSKCCASRWKTAR